jgi:hypothetical protein
MVSRLELRCISIIVGKRSKIGIILLIIISLLSADLSTHGSPSCLFYSSQICEAPMVPILIGTSQVLFKCSEQLVECLLIHLNATNTIMMVIGAPV